MNKTAVEFIFHSFFNEDIVSDYVIRVFEQAKEMERNEKLKHQLFIGKVTEIIGFDKAVELWKECDEVFKSEQQ